LGSLYSSRFFSRAFTRQFDSSGLSISLPPFPSLYMIRCLYTTPPLLHLRHTGPPVESFPFLHNALLPDCCYFPILFLLSLSAAADLVRRSPQESATRRQHFSDGVILTPAPLTQNGRSRRTACLTVLPFFKAVYNEGIEPSAEELDYTILPSKIPSFLLSDF